MASAIPKSLHRALIDLVMILGGVIIISFLINHFHIDEIVAVKIYNPSTLADSLAEVMGQICGIVIPSALFVACLFPKMRKKYPSLLTITGVWIATMLVGHNMLVANLKQVSNRPRPRETTLVGQNGTMAFKPIFDSWFPIARLGSQASFPSSAAAMGFSICSPFFVLRKKDKKAALMFLIFGLLLGSVIGFARMMIGKHFLSDVLWAGAIMLSVATLASCVRISLRDQR